jgi:endonuclease V-like protein UPF0215 family
MGARPASLRTRDGRDRSGKPHPRVFAFDDAPFRFGQEETAVVGVVVSLPGYLEGLVKGSVRVDGDEATDTLSRLVNASRFRPASQAILLGGISLAGFNVVDLAALHRRTGLPVVTVTRREPDFAAMSRALHRHIGDRAEEREHRWREFPLFPFRSGPRPLWVASAGLDREEASALLRKSLVRGSYPEPLRLAHRIAALFSDGEVPRARA